ncbi:zinc finger protein 271-like [Adelges cooleyi]|uniref:zinc finger protein 271-like n=1 Tax=Adelges cooleyi TaxID=133065 RepID=UPI00218082D5|nr:zinc finger protein 271-like [Adelges cooleyi]
MSGKNIQDENMNFLRNGIQNIDINSTNINNRDDIETIKRQMQSMHIENHLKQEFKCLETTSLAASTQFAEPNVKNSCLLASSAEGLHNTDENPYSLIKSFKITIKKPHHRAKHYYFGYDDNTDIEMNKYNCFAKYKCGYCNSKFFKRYHLVKHIEMAHNKNGKKSCDLCRKQFTGYKDLIKHKKRHWENKYKCDICKKRFVHSKDFRNHKKSHDLNFHRFNKISKSI